MTLTRAKLEQLTGDLIERTIEPCRRALADAKLKPADIAEAVLVGGMTRMPAVQEAVRKFFAGSRTRASTRTRSSRSVRRSRRACWAAR